MPIGTPALVSPYGYARLTKEVTWSTPLAATVDLPTLNRELAGEAARISPEFTAALRSRDLYFIKGRQMARGRLSGPVMSVSTGHILMGTFGSDTISGAGPYNHLFKSTQTASLPSYTLEVNHGGLTGATNSEQYAGAMINRLTLSSRFDQDDAVLEWDAEVMSLFPTRVTSTTYATPAATDGPAAASVCTAQYGGSNWAKAAEVTGIITNNLVPVKTANAGSLDLQNMVPALLEGAGTARIVFDAYTSEYTDWTSLTQRAITFTWTFKTADTLLMNIPAAMISNWKFVNRRNGVVEATFDWRGSHDATATGPISMTLVNTRSTAY